jgi:hypothetical protein
MGNSFTLGVVGVVGGIVSAPNLAAGAKEKVTRVDRKRRYTPRVARRRTMEEISFLGVNLVHIRAWK